MVRIPPGVLFDPTKTEAKHRLGFFVRFWLSRVQHLVNQRGEGTDHRLRLVNFSEPIRWFDVLKNLLNGPKIQIVLPTSFSPARVIDKIVLPDFAPLPISKHSFPHDSKRCKT